MAKDRSPTKLDPSTLQRWESATPPSPAQPQYLPTPHAPQPPPQHPEPPAAAAVEAATVQQPPSIDPADFGLLGDFGSRAVRRAGQTAAAGGRGGPGEGAGTEAAAPASEGVEDLAARLEELQREVQASAVRVRRINHEELYV